MTEIDALPADQRAVLQLLVKQGQTYDALSGLLNIDPAAVRERAHAALEALGPDAGRRLAPERPAQGSGYPLRPQAAPPPAGARRPPAGAAPAPARAPVGGGAPRPRAPPGPA